jgi:hypothetical protein
MPSDLVGALAGWLVSLAGGAGIRLVCGSPDERALSRAMGLAIGMVVDTADPSVQDALRLGLRQCFTARTRIELDAYFSSGAATFRRRNTSTAAH